MTFHSAPRLDLAEPGPYIRLMGSMLEGVYRRPVRTILLLSLVLFVSGNWVLPLMDRDEPRFGEASREMRQRGDYLVPWFNGQYRFDKPPLIYWCQIASYRVLGENAFAARLPSACFAVATALLLLAWGRRLGQPRAGLYAALMFMTCVQVLIHARTAVADMPMICAVTAAVWSGWEMTRPSAEHRSRWWWMFYASLALGFLAKGPIAWLPLGGLLLGRRLRSASFMLSPGKVVLGLGVTLAMLSAWGVPALRATHGEFFTVGIGYHVLFRSFGVLEGHGARGWLGLLAALPLYPLTFFLSFFPWALRVPAALRDWWPTRHQDAIGWYLLVQAALVFAVFTMVRTKFLHYTLPAFPCLSLWLALAVVGKPDVSAWIGKWAVAMACVTLVLTLGIFRVARPWFVTAHLWQQARPFAKPEMEFATVEFNEPSLVWEFRQVLTNDMQQVTLDQASGFLQAPGPAILVLPTKYFSSSIKDLATNALTFHATGVDTASFKRLDLTAVVRR